MILPWVHFTFDTHCYSCFSIATTRGAVEPDVSGSRPMRVSLYAFLPLFLLMLLSLLSLLNDTLSSIVNESHKKDIGLCTEQIIASTSSVLIILKK